MARRKADDGEHEARSGKQKRRDSAETVTQVAHAIRHRDEIVASALDMLAAVGALDPRTKEHVHDTYQRGDAYTRAAIQELIARALRVPPDAIEATIESRPVEPERLSGRALAALADLSLPELDVKATADRVRGLDVDGWVARAESRSGLVRALGDLPLKVRKVQLGFMAAGVVLLALVGVALLFPGEALWIAFFGLLGLLAFLGALLVVVSIRIRNLAKSFGVDLGVMARLEPEERRILLLRRVAMQLFDRERAGDLVERGLAAMVPEALREDRPAAARRHSGTPARPLPKRDDSGGKGTRS